MNMTSTPNTSESGAAGRRLSGFWSSLSLARKLLVAFGALAALAIIVGISDIIGLNRVQHAYEHAITDGEAMQYSSQHLYQNIILARRHEKDFLLRWQAEGFDSAYANYVIPQQEAVDVMRQEIDSLSAYAVTVGEDPSLKYPQAEYEADLQVLKDETAAYEQGFLKTVQLIKERGANDTGLAGGVKTSAQAIENRISGRDGTDPLMVALLSTRRYEKDYMLNSDQIFVDQLHQSATTLKQEITFSDALQASDKRELSALVDQYVTNFDALVAKDAEINTTIQDYRDADHVMEPIITRIDTTGDASSKSDVANAEASGAQTIVIASSELVAALLIAFILSLVLSRQITRPVTQLTQAAHELETGNYDAQTEVTTKDELGTLGAAFNAMARQLKESIALINKRAVELQAVAEIATNASQAANVQDMLQTVVNETKNAYNLYHAHVYLMNDDNSRLVLAAGAGEAGRQMVSERRSIALDHPHSLVARAARSNQGAISNDVTKEPDFLPNPLLPDTRAEMAIPVSVGGRVLGVLDVQADYIDRFTNEDIAIKTTLAQQIAASLETLHQFEISQKMAGELGTVAEISTATATISDIDELLQEVVNRTKRAFNLYHVHIYLTNEAGDTLVLTSGAGEIGKKMVAEKRKIALDSEKSLVARAARTQKGQVVNDVKADPDFLPHPLLPDTRSEMAVPMLVGDRVIGVLDVQSELLDRFTEIDVNIKTTLAAQIAVALQNANTFAETQARAQQEALLNTVNQKIQSTATIEAALQIAARELGHVFGKKSTAVMLNLSQEFSGNGHGNQGNGS